VTIRLPLLLCGVVLLECAGGLAANQQKDHSPETAGTVYFYYEGFQQPKGMIGPAASIGVLVDGRVVASPKMKTYFGIKLPSGRHTLASKSRRTNPKETAIEVDLKPKQQLFIRLEMMIAGLGIVKYTAHLRVVSQQDGRAVVAALQPLAVSEIEDKVRVTTELPGPAGDAASTTPDPAKLPGLLPDEQGIFVVQDGALQRLRGETTTVRIASIWGHTAALKNARSATRLKLPLEFVIRAAAETTADEYILMHLFMRKDRREFRTLEAGKSGWQGPERMMVPFESRRLAPNVYHLTVLAVPKGEYGFLRPGTRFTDSAASSLTFTFGVD
jgi:hypothetical protein